MSMRPYLTSVAKYRVKESDAVPIQFTIGRFAAAAGVTVETIRFYQRKRLIRQPSRAFGRIRRYDESDVARVRFVKAAQQLGFTLEEIASLLHLDDGAHCDEARTIAEEKFAGVRARLDQLRSIETVLGAVIDECRASGGQVRCPLIAALQQPRE